jgi:branched-chain amino acid transport system ATP-binding protein
MLKVENLGVGYGLTDILSGMSLEIGEKEVVAIVGPNGHGKSTLLKSIAGLNPPKSGQIWFDGTRIDKLSPYEITCRGITLMPEGGGYLPNFTVSENLRLGAYTNRQGFHDHLNEVHTLFPWLKERRSQIAWTLSGGERKMLAIARSLMTLSRLLLLDEPTWGVAPRIADEILGIVGHIRDMGRSLLLAESNMSFAGQVADRLVLLKNNKLEPISKTSIGEKRIEHMV